MDARARAKRYEKLDFLGEGQVNSCWARRGRRGPLRGGWGARGALGGPGRAGLGCVARHSVSEAGPAPACVAGPVGSGLRAAIPLWSLLSLSFSPLSLPLVCYCV